MRIVFEGDSITNIAHQLGYFETIARADFVGELQDRIHAVTPGEVAACAQSMFDDTRRPVGWFDPLPMDSSVTNADIA